MCVCGWYAGVEGGWDGDVGFCGGGGDKVGRRGVLFYVIWALGVVDFFSLRW